MRFWRDLSPLVHAATPKKGDRRRGGRVYTEALRCNRGAVLDLSPGGARLRCRSAWPRDEVRSITLRSGSDRAEIDAKCVWTRRKGFFRHLVGLRFVNLKDDEARLLVDLARRHVGPAPNRRAA